MDDSDLQEHLRSFESSFDRAMSGCRQIASAWILATLLGFGTLLLKLIEDSSGVISNPGVWPVVVTLEVLPVLPLFLGLLGLALLFYLDQAVYQKLLHSIFIYGMYIEHKRKGLDKIKWAMYRNCQNISPLVSYFYILPILFFYPLYFFFSLLVKIIVAQFGIRVSCRAY